MSNKEDESKLPESVLLKREATKLRQDMYAFILVVLLIACATGLLATLFLTAPHLR